MRSISVSLLTALVLIAPLTTCVARAQISLSVYLSAPKSQSAIYDSTTTETFESLPTGLRTVDFSSGIGTYELSESNPFFIEPDDQFGTGTGQYMAFGRQSNSSEPITLRFAAPQSYFGFSWNAGDNLNGLSFYRNDLLISRFSTSDITTLLSSQTVTALDNTVYNSVEYKGNPITGENNSELYSFVNFFSGNGGFDRIVFDNSGTIGSGFESDNHTIRTAAPTPDGSFVFVTQVVAPGVAPEPGSIAFLLAVTVPGIVSVVRRKTRTFE